MAASPVARVSLLDGFTLELGGRESKHPCDDLPRAVQRLIAYLALVVRPARTSVAGTLWPDVTEHHAQGSLRSALWRLQQFAPGLIASSSGSLVLADGVDVDVRELDRWARWALDPAWDITDIETPAAGLQGDLLPGWYDDWVLLERERLRQARMHTLEVIARRLSSAGRHGEAVEAAHAAVRAEPLRESAHRTLVRVHLAEGNVNEALRIYDRFQLLLDDELGVAPSGQMTDLVQGLRRGPAAAQRNGRVLAGS